MTDAERFRRALASLVSWKDYKDAHGSDAAYQQGKRAAWLEARSALTAAAGVDNEAEIARILRLKVKRLDDALHHAIRVIDRDSGGTSMDLDKIQAIINRVDTKAALTAAARALHRQADGTDEEWDAYILDAKTALTGAVVVAKNKQTKLTQQTKDEPMTAPTQAQIDAAKQTAIESCASYAKKWIDEGGPPTLIHFAIRSLGEKDD